LTVALNRQIVVDFGQIILEKVNHLQENRVFRKRQAKHIVGISLAFKIPQQELFEVFNSFHQRLFFEDIIQVFLWINVMIFGYFNNRIQICTGVCALWSIGK